jgi:hypothetical protein
MNLFNLAYIELEREGKLNKKNTLSLMLRRAIKIRKFLDLQEDKRVETRFKKLI